MEEEVPKLGSAEGRHQKGGFQEQLAKEAREVGARVLCFSQTF